MLAIAQARIDCTLVDGASPERFRALENQLLAGLRHNLPAALGAAEIPGSGIVHIERLSIALSIDLAWSDTTIARAIAEALLDGMEEAVAAPETVRFVDEADRVARFLIDLADGAAFTRTWHEPYDGLKLLPASAIVRTLAQINAATTLAALARLAPAQRRRIAALMAPADAARAVAVLAVAPGLRGRDPAAIVAALEVCRDAGSLADPAAVLAFAAALHAHDGTVADAETVALARALLQGAPTSAAPPGAATVADGHRPTAAADAPDRSLRESPHGGAWLLLPQLLELGAGLADTLAALALCAGPDAAAVRRDAALHDALGVDADWDDGEPAQEPPLPVVASRRDLEHMRKAAAQLDLAAPARRRARRLALAAVRAYARRLPGFGEASLPHLWRNLLAAPARVDSGGDSVLVALTPPPLSVVWRLSGADRADYRLPDGRRVQVRSES